MFSKNERKSVEIYTCLIDLFNLVESATISAVITMLIIVLITQFIRVNELLW